MSEPAAPFAIRPLAHAGATLQQLRDAVLRAPPGTNLVLLRISNSPVHFPPICPGCERPAASSLRIERAFLFHVQNDSDTPNDTIQSIDAFNVPFCNACLHQHRAQQAPPSPWTPFKRLLSDGKGFAGLFVIGIALLFLKSAIERFSIFPLALAALPLATGGWLLRSTWRQSRHMSVPPPTNVDLAVDFTPSLALPFEPHWRAFLFRSPEYARQFSRANIHDLWNPTSMEAQAAAAQRSERSRTSNLVVGAIVVAVLLWGLWDFLSPFVRPLFDR
jgi:hypothetical protein